MSTINLDPPEDFLEARQLTALVERWLASLKVASVTLATYRSKMAHFIRWWERIGPAVEWRLTKSLLQDFESHLCGIVTERFDKPMSYGNRHSIIRALRMMFKWAATTERTVKNYGIWVPWPAGAPPKRKAATVEQLTRLMLAATESHMPVRDQAILAFFIGTGCRRGEVAALNVEDLTILADGSGTAFVTGKHTRANPSGERSIAFDATTGQYLIRYMDAYGLVSGPLWLNKFRESVSAPGIYQMVKRTIERADLTAYVHGCHDLRRAFATILGLMHPDSPAWADMIRRQLGHTHYSQTAAYMLMDVENIRDMIVNPLARG